MILVLVCIGGHEVASDLARTIREKALELGYDDCGIIDVAQMSGYEEKLAERFEAFPNSAEKLKMLNGFAAPALQFPWVKSVVVCVRHFGRYRIPEHLNGLIAKYYLVDGRVDPHSDAYKATDLFDAFLREQGLQTATERKFGLTALRWAAVQAGLGIFRKNNFFYTEKGSWVCLEAWLIDEELELLSSSKLKPCKEGCTRCIDSCPTKSLATPYAMNRDSCVSCLTTWDGRNMPEEKFRTQMGGWVFGCDACQDACPHNRNKWRSEETFPGLDELGECISLEKILAMDYKFLEDVMSTKFFYINKNDVWKWKVNAINAMINENVSKYQASIEAACEDPHEKVREMVHFALSLLDR